MICPLWTGISSATAVSLLLARRSVRSDVPISVESFPLSNYFKVHLPLVYSRLPLPRGRPTPRHTRLHITPRAPYIDGPHPTTLISWKVGLCKKSGVYQPGMVDTNLSEGPWPSG